MVMFKEAFTMANGIGNNELRKKKVNRPAGKEDMTIVCVARLAQTEKFTIFKMM